VKVLAATGFFFTPATHLTRFRAIAFPPHRSNKCGEFLLQAMPSHDASAPIGTIAPLNEPAAKIVRRQLSF
jgi:hypothetical protein